ncbi:MAG: DUF2231 domain-containing protein [Planctomycetes bacterium]|nr:DUF2231 domain-containing protein [Planctomycetota bacterium]
MTPYLHPPIVHFTIALVAASVLFDLLGVLLGKDSLHAAAWWNLLAGTIAVILTVATGLLAERAAEHDEAAHGVLEVHKAIGLTALAMTLALFTWRAFAKGRLPRRLRALYLLVSVLTMGTVLAGGYFGGELVFGHGVGVRAVQGLSPQHLGQDHKH